MTNRPLKPVPQPGIMEIAPYVGGASSLPGIDRVIKLSSNENPWGPSPRALEAYSKAAPSLYKYPDGHSVLLREAIAEVEHLPVENIIAGTGSDEILNLIAYAYAGVGDEIVYSEHGFLVYPLAARTVGATPVPVAEKEYTLDVDGILNAITPRTKIVYIANPNNPTGTCVPLSELQRLHSGLRSDVVLVLDGAYAEFSQMAGYDSGASLVSQAENVIMTRTFSKVYGLAALRVGWAYGSSEIIDVLNRIRGPFNVSIPGIYAAREAFLHTDWTAEIVEKTLYQRRQQEDFLRSLSIPFSPSEANFLLLHLDKEGKTAAAADEFLKKQGIIIRRMEAYHLPHCLRVSVGTEEQNQAFQEALKAFWSA